MKTISRLNDDNIKELFSYYRFKQWVESKPDDFVFPSILSIECLFTVYITETTEGIKVNSVGVSFATLESLSGKVVDVLYPKTKLMVLFWESESWKELPDLPYSLTKQQILKRLREIKQRLLSSEE